MIAKAAAETLKQVHFELGGKGRTCAEGVGDIGDGKIFIGDRDEMTGLLGDLTSAVSQ